MTLYGAVRGGDVNQRLATAGTAVGYGVGVPLAWLLGVHLRWPRPLLGVWLGNVAALTIAAVWVTAIVASKNWGAVRRASFAARRTAGASRCSTVQWQRRRLDQPRDERRGDVWSRVVDFAEIDSQSGVQLVYGAVQPASLLEAGADRLAEDVLLLLARLLPRPRGCSAAPAARPGWRRPPSDSARDGAITSST